MVMIGKIRKHNRKLKSAMRKYIKSSDPTILIHINKLIVMQQTLVDMYKASLPVDHPFEKDF